MVELNKDRIAKLKTIKLQNGAHPSVVAGMCAMEAAAWIAGEEHSDHPQCVSPVIAAFMRRWNDALDDRTRQRLKPYIIRCVGTGASQEFEERRAWLAVDWLVRTYLPTWLDLARLTQEADQVRALPEITSATVAASLPTLQTVQKMANSTRDVTRSAAARDAGNAAENTAWTIAWIAAEAAPEGAAAWAAAEAAAWNAAKAAVRAVVGAAEAAAEAAAWNAAKAAVAAKADAARLALKSTVKKLQQSAFKLLDRMIECGSSAKLDDIPESIKTFGEAIRWARERKGMTIRSLSARMRVSASFVHDVEHNRRHPRNIERWAKELGVSVDELQIRK